MKKKAPYRYETLPKKVLKVILKVLVIFIVIGIVGDIFWEIANTSGYTEEELRIYCNSNNLSEFGLTSRNV